MKLSSTLFLAAIALTTAEDAVSCLPAFELEFSDCSLDKVVSLVKKLMKKTEACDGSDPLTEIAIILGKDPEDEEAIEEYIEIQCEDAYNAYLDYEGEMPTYTSVTKQNSVFNTEFFNGGTYWNEGRESIESGKLKDSLKKNPGKFISKAYKSYVKKTPMDWPDEMANFEACELQAAMCCWVQDRQAGDDNGNCNTPYDEECVDADPADNTDICAVDMSRAPESARVANGYAFFPGDDDDGEGAAHCHGFAWGDPLGDLYKSNNLFFVSMYDHLYQRGYVRNVPGAPMCGCVEQMPIVSRADCTQIDVDEVTSLLSYNGVDEVELEVVQVKIEFNECEGANGIDNDLDDHYALLVQEGLLDEEGLGELRQTLVGPNDNNEPSNCPDAITALLADV